MKEILGCWQGRKMIENFQMGEEKIQIEWWHGGWDDAEDAELEKQRSNLGTKDGVGSECTKAIILFILKVDYHISHCCVPKMI